MTYVTDALKLLTENTAKYAGGSFFNVRFADIGKANAEDTRSGDEIAADIIRRAGLKVKT